MTLPSPGPSHFTAYSGEEIGRYLAAIDVQLGKREASMDDTKAHDSEDSIGARFRRYMANHFVALVGGYESYDRGVVFKRGVFTFSGFILELHGRVFWVTAGHCLKSNLDNRIRKGQLRLHHCGFADYFGDNVRDDHNIPFAYEPGCAFYIDDQSRGLDFGLIPLDFLTVQNLAANGIKVVSRQNWVHQPSLEFTRYAMFGIPSDQVMVDEGPNGAMQARARGVLLWLDRLAPNEVRDPLPDEWFVGRIDPRSTVRSIVGICGGPIYGFRWLEDRRQWSYHVVALQSRWRESERVVFGCSLPFFAELLHQAARD